MSKYFCTIVLVTVVAHRPLLTTRVIISLLLCKGQLLFWITINCKCFCIEKNISFRFTSKYVSPVLCTEEISSLDTIDKKDVNFTVSDYILNNTL